MLKNAAARLGVALFLLAMLTSGGSRAQSVNLQVYGDPITANNPLPVTQGLGSRPGIEIGSNSFATSQPSVAATSTLVVAARGGRAAVTIVNLGTTAVYLGASGVTTSTGLLLPGVVGASVTIPTVAAVFGVAASGSQSVSVLETY